METIEATGERLAESKKVEFVSSLVLGGRSLLRITMTDGRIVKGHFICLDRKKNLILANVLEERFISLAVYTGKEASEESDILVKRELR
jgi:small nuclear ribonucleoprotein (snRNP)-like protein